MEINMNYIKGKYTRTIYSSSTGYTVGLFRVREASDDLSGIINRTVTFTGNIIDINDENMYLFKGEYINNPKYGYQFRVDEYEVVEPAGKDAIYEFLSSSFVSGCGKRTAKKNHGCG